MRFNKVETGNFKLDGGAMFGVVPKVMWSKAQPADENNLCSWAMRCLIVEQGKQLILIDNGLGNKQSDKFFGHYYLHGNDSLYKSLNALGYDVRDITDVLLTHLHFDHCGGSVSWNADKTGYEIAFPNATYHVCEQQWNWAVNPNAREKASFLRENIMPMQESGHLKLFSDLENNFFDNIEFEYVYGHTEAMVVPIITYKGQKYGYMADLLPSHSHIPLPYLASYDIRPLQSLQEKNRILNRAYNEKWICIFEHDAYVEACTLAQTERGIVFGEKVHLSDVL